MLPVWIALVVLPILGGAERFNCRGRILGAYYADAKAACKAFHVCVRVAGGGVRDFRFYCPPGTLFHQEAQTCTDWGLYDDPLACPAEIYDGYDTKKVSSPGNRDEESDFGLQRAETGDRRLSQNNGASDLRAAHSSDFFSGQRDRGRDDPAPAPQQRQQQQQQQQQQPQQQSPQHAPSRQSFRRPTTPRAVPTTTQYTNPPTPPPEQSNPPFYDNSKRKLVRKRPFYPSYTTTTELTTTVNTQPPFVHPEQQAFQNFNRRVPLNRQAVNVPQQNRQTVQPVNIPAQNNRQTIPPVNVPPQFKEYKEEYVEVPRVTPKPSKFIQTNPTPSPFSQSTPAANFKKSLVELYNYDAQSTPGLNTPNDRPFKVHNSFNVADIPRENYFRAKNPKANSPAPTTLDYDSPARVTTSTPAFKNYNSVSYEPEKNNFISSKQNYFTNPSTPPSTTTYITTNRPDPSLNLNTVAYNTNIGFDAQQTNYADSDEDDGQYRPPQGEDDGQYRPELYERERELLSGAHSLNIAASGNRLPEDQKPKGKTQPPFKPVSQTAAPRPFRPAPTPSSSPRVPEKTYPTTIRPQTQTPPQSQRTFDYYQTYTTTSRPSEASAATFNLDGENFPVRPTTTYAPRNPEPRQQTRASTAPPAPPTQPPAPLRPTSSTRPPFFANPASNKENASYDYAYYDSDPGFTEYDHIEEFGKTNKKA